MRIHAYIHTEQYYGKRIEKHLLFFTIISTKSCYLLFSVILFWLTEKMFHIGSFFEYGFLWSANEEEVSDTCLLSLTAPSLVPLHHHPGPATAPNPEGHTCPPPTVSNHPAPYFKAEFIAQTFNNIKIYVVYKDIN